MSRIDFRTQYTLQVWAEQGSTGHQNEQYTSFPSLSPCLSFILPEASLSLLLLIQFLHGMCLSFGCRKVQMSSKVYIIKSWSPPWSSWEMVAPNGKASMRRGKTWPHFFIFLHSEPKRNAFALPHVPTTVCCFL